MTHRMSAAIGAVLAAIYGGSIGPAAQQDMRGQFQESEDLRGDEESSASRFGRMFHLPPFADATPSVKAALVRLGARGGPLDARDNLAAGPLALIVDPLLSAGNPNNDAHTAGITFFGQFLDHDMTFDTSSRLGKPTDVRRSRNARRPFFDLDSVYGDGPAGSPQLYEKADRAKLRVERGGVFEDLPREVNGRAIIADPRNDENVVVAGLQAAMLLVHNRAVDEVRLAHPRMDTETVFAKARRLVTWHYQWIILHEFLPQVVGAPTVNRVLADRHRHYRPKQDDAFIPVEFQLAYRMGHSMVRPSYRANFTGNAGGPFIALVFDPSQEDAADPSDLRGGVRSPRRFVGWSTFFRFPGLEADVRPNKRLDTHLSTPLFDLPLGAIASGMPPTSLAERNLLRHLTWLPPSGQAIAERLGVPALRSAQLSELAAIHPSFVRSTPLWYYVLKEAEVVEQGVRLGPVGGRLVAEVFIGLLQSDSDSFLSAEDRFVPSFGPTPGAFTIVDLLNFAGVGGHR
jgi:Animal haem peroxidase